MHLVALLFVANLAFAYSSFDKEDELYLIRSGHSSNLVLDATDPNQVKIEPYTGYSAQLWKFVRASKAGYFYIINHYTGDALDYQYRPTQKNKYLLKLAPLSQSSRQEYMINKNGRLSNVYTGENIDIVDAQFRHGTSVQLWGDNGDQAQEFNLQKKT
ncbi:hypothetical protein Zmor_024521 [Zophobas morio]|uniref:Ricin B lectin domain-containing protein n=1 Tax=Zophobas morio TaxID=2755281 RepID=A0AA38I0D0_9CUCU|nr:hypothetical protein Zmor_024521 [Zophobas morio]